MLSNILHKYKVLSILICSRFSGKVGYALTYPNNIGQVSCSINYSSQNRRINPYA